MNPANSRGLKGKDKLKELADKEALKPTTRARMLIIRAIRDKAAESNSQAHMEQSVKNKDLALLISHLT